MLKRGLVAAFDVYSGRQLWQRGNTFGPMAACPDVLYHGRINDIEIIDAATGKRTRLLEGCGGKPVVAGDLLLVLGERSAKAEAGEPVKIVCMDRGKGSVLWEMTWEPTSFSFVAGGGRAMYCSMAKPGRPEVRVLDLWSGRLVSTIDLTKGVSVVKKDISPARKGRVPAPYDLAFQEDSGILVVRCNKPIPMTFPSGKKRDAFQVAAYRMHDGKLLWAWSDQRWMHLHLTRNLVVGSRGWHDGSTGHAFDLLTGKLRLSWEGKRTCGSRLAVNDYLFAGRAEIAGYYDLANGTGYHSLGPFRSGCQSRMAIANGVLFRPDAHWGCSCQTVLHAAAAYIHDPDAALVTYVPMQPAPYRAQGITTWESTRYRKMRD
jgi:hypothetical protein